MKVILRSKEFQGWNTGAMDFDSDDAVAEYINSGMPLKQFGIKGEWNVEYYVEPALSVDELRKKDEINEGINAETMLEALWEKTMNNKREKADAIKTKKQAIKLKYPKKNIK